MFLLVLIMVSHMVNSSHEPTYAPVVVHHGALAARSSSLSEDELCEAALQTFMKRTDSDIAKYIKTHLTSAIKEASSSPESDSDVDSPSPKRIMRTWIKQPESVKSTPKKELDEIVLAAVQKSFEEKEAELEKKSKKIEDMFSKKATALITTIVGVVVTIVTSLASIYGTRNSSEGCNK